MGEFVDDFNTEAHPYREIYGEPVARPDGVSIVMYRTHRNELEVEIGPTGWYSEEDVLTLGDGDFDRGALRIGRAYYAADRDDLLTGGMRLLHDEIADSRNR